jgi:16S rRNA (adenine1518-N6/adenine1519-N6)-dimethyltransferase
VSGLAEPSTVERLLRAHQLHARKSLGQHFLTDAQVLADILDAAELSPTDEVLEVGPGLGTLTEALLQRAGRVVAVEFDPQLAAALPATLGAPRHLEVICAPIAAFAPCEHFAARGYSLVANIPYYLTGDLLRRFLQDACPPQRMVLLLQKEVGLRLAGVAGDWSALTVAAHLFAEPRMLREVPASSFTPAPRVDSALVRLDVLPSPALPVPPEAFLRFVTAVFQHRRKQLHNALRSVAAGSGADADALLRSAGLERDARPQTVDLQAWGRLYAVVAAAAPSRFAEGTLSSV